MPKKKIDITWFVDIFKAIGTIAGGLASVAVLFVVTGYAIVLSFTREMGFYGLASFPREFFMEANLQFISDLGGFLGKDYNLLLFIFALASLLLLVISCRRYNLLNLVFMTLAVIALLTTFNLAFFSKNAQKFIIFSMSMPFLAALTVYLAMNIDLFGKNNSSAKNRYISFVILLILFFLSIPISYGRHIYDLDVYNIRSFEYDSKYENNSLKNMRENIMTVSGEAYYLMGHTAGREIFFIAPSYNKEIVIVDRGAITFLKIEGKGPGLHTIRNIINLQPQPFAPMQTLQTPSDKEKKELKTLLNRFPGGKK